MTDHAHRWTPIAGLFARYECSCGATGYRAWAGEIREHKTRLARPAKVNVRPYLETSGRIPPKPTSRG
jgi:hypothetical protein